MACWIEELKSFQFSVEHWPGAQHANADALSWRPCALSGCSYCDRKDIRERELLGQEASTALTCCMLQVVDAAEWAARQEGDEDLGPVRQWIYSGQRPQRLCWVCRWLQSNSGVNSRCCVSL